MDLTISLAFVTIIGSVSAVAGYFLMRRKFLIEIERGKKREEELASKIYEVAVTRELDERIGYSLNADKIVEIISGSLGNLLPYSAVSHMIMDEDAGNILFECHVNETVSRKFIGDVKVKMLAAFSEMLQEPLVDIDIDERVAGRILDESSENTVGSFFNLPIIILGRVIGIINIASNQAGLYDAEKTAVLYRIANQASDAVSKFQEVLESEKGKLVQAVESLSDGILMVDTRYQLILVNKKLRELLGVGEQPKIFDVVNALAGTFDLRSKMEEALSNNTGLAPFEIVLRDKVLQVYASGVVTKKSDKPLGVVVLFHDITDAKSLERLRQDFTAMMVHELRAPLTTIKSTVEMVMGTGSVAPDDLGRYLGTIDATAATMLELVNDLLDVAKVEAGKFDVICEEGDIGEVILERVESFRPQTAAKNLKLDVLVEKNLPPAWFDKVRIKQVVNNLLSNAIKYTETGSVKINVAVESANGQAIDILVSVADTGIGIEADQAEKLFSKFGQLATGRAKAGLKSSGLGLYITKRIVEASGGKIWVESAGPATGSTFFFTVQLAEAASKNQADDNLMIPGAITRPIKNFTSSKVGQA